MKGSLGSMFGLDMRDPAQKLEGLLKNADTSTEAGQQEILGVVKQFDPAKALVLQQAFLEQNATKKQLDFTQSMQRGQLELQQGNLALQKAQENRLVGQNERDIIADQEARAAAEANRIIQSRNLDLQGRRIDADILRINADAENNKTQENALGAQDRKAIRDASAEARTNFTRAQRLINVANQYAVDKPTPGWLGSMQTTVENFLGQQGGENMLRAEYEQLRSTGIMSALPPGAASDADVMLAAQGWPSSYTNPETLASFMKGMAKISAMTAEYENGRAQWMAANNGLDHAYADHWTSITERGGGEEFLKGLSQKYGVAFQPALPIEGADADVRAANQVPAR
jgi:hypothetical protein